MSIERFIWDKGDVNTPACWQCRHLLRDGRCKAFPDGIPDNILRGENNHTKPYPGDNGIQFEKVQP